VAGIKELVNDAHKFIPKLNITDKRGKNIKLYPNDEQTEILQSLLTGDDTLILKPRQIGSTTIIAAYLFWVWYSAEEPVTIAVMSHKLQSSKHILGIMKKYYNNLPAKLRCKLTTENTTEIVKENGAKIIAVSAEAKGGMRSFTATHLMISEYAFAERPEEMLSTAISSINEGQLIIESTANYYGDCLHNEIQKAQCNEGGWNFKFFPWSRHKEYALIPPDDFMLSPEEKKISIRYNLTDAQMHWRRKKAQRLGANQFCREYPLSIAEAYTQGADAYFTEDDLQYTGGIPSAEDSEILYLNKPLAHHKYAIGVDVSAGVGKDYSALTVFDKSTYNTVCIYRTNTQSTAKFSETLHHIATEYNKARVLIESNNMGVALLTEMRHKGYTNLWCDDNNKDWLTTIKTKPLIFEALKETLAQGVITLLDDLTLSELRAFVVDHKGRLEIAHGARGHGDTVIALALGLHCLASVSHPKQEYLPSWIRKKRAKQIRNAGAFKGLSLNNAS
tara:strand:- start:74 stop:1585 length:1512 start_codon:yes stop_codon:yes gene_type:complete